MGLKELQEHLNEIVAGVETHDLLKLAHNKARKGTSEKLKLIVDAENCLDRLYGGYFPDWVCGGQWNKMDQFLRNFANVVLASELELLVAFNGALEPSRYEHEWKAQQERTAKFIEEINQHVSHKKKPPPKVWWLPPAYLRTAIRYAFRSFDVKTMSTLEDHHKEIARYCVKNNFHGIIADDAEYFLFDIPRYFSGGKLKLTFRGSLETTELKLAPILAELKLTREQFLIVGCLLGNHILTEDDLASFYSSSFDGAVSVQKLIDFVIRLGSNEIDVITTAMFPGDEDTEKRKDIGQKLSASLAYYSELLLNSKSEVKKSGNKKGSKDKGKQEEKSQKLNGVETGKISKVDGSLPSDSQKLEGDASEIFSDADSQTIPNDSGPSSEPSSTSLQLPKSSSLEKFLYRVNPEIENVCITRHRSGLMSPHVYHILKHREIKLSAIVQESKDVRETIRHNTIFRTLRSKVYAVLFNLHHLHYMAKERGEPSPDIWVKETSYCPHSKGLKSKNVAAVEIGWPVPTVERLWLGDKEECKRKRTRAYLAIMKSDRPIVLDSNYVPQQMLVMTTVLRYILSEGKILRKTELDAFIAQAFIQELTDPGIAQEIEVYNLTMRGVALAHMFMEGVDMAGLANDACGAPIPYMLFSPGMYFNGKVFAYILEQQEIGKSIGELCNFKVDLLYSIDQLRQAVTEGIKIQFALPPAASFIVSNGAPLMNQLLHPPHSRSPHISSGFCGGPAASAANLSHLSSRLLQQSQQSQFFIPPAGANYGVGAGIYGNYSPQLPLYSELPGRVRRDPGGISTRGGGRGGQLEVAGITVGSWSPNYGPRYNYAQPGINTMARIPMGPGAGAANAYLNHNFQQMNSIFEEMRISGGAKSGGNYNSNSNYNQPSQRYNSRTFSNSKKNQFKKPNFVARSQNANTNSKGTVNGKNGASDSKSSKPAKDEGQRLDAGDAPQQIRSEKETSESSPIATVVGSSQAN